MRTAQCVTCGKTIRVSPSQEGRRRYCSKACMPQSKMVTLVCEFCGKTYEKRDCYAERSRYCSRVCHGRAAGRRQTEAATVFRLCPVCGKTYQTTQHHGGSKTCGDPGCVAKSKANLKGEHKTERVCPACGKTFKEWPSRPKRFCSNRCATSSAGPRASEMVGCEHCGQEFRIANCRIRGGRRFCSDQCYKSFKGPSTPEKLVSSWLVDRHVDFVSQIRLGRFVIDFYANGWYIEVNGCYWHGCPEHFPPRNRTQRRRVERDSRLLEKCEADHIPLIVLWEHDIRAGRLGQLEAVVRRASS